MEINFKPLEVCVSFDGEKRVFDVARDLGNLMKYNGSVLLDIGFEKLAEEIYFSGGAVEVPDRYCPAIKEVVQSSGFIAAIKRELIRLMEKEG